VEATNRGSVPIVVACEGVVDEAILRRLLEEVGAEASRVYGRNGKEQLRRQIRGYNEAARRFPWVVLVDLNDEADCPPPLVEAWVPEPAPHLCFRVAVREVEAWLMADPERFARFLSVARSRLPAEPEGIEDPKETVVSLARRSRRRAIREDIVPRPGSGRTVGPAYSSQLIEFVADRDDGWRPGVAAENAESLDRCIRRLTGLEESWRERLEGGG